MGYLVMGEGLFSSHNKRAMMSDGRNHGWQA